MFDQRRSRWADVGQILYKCFVFTGLFGTPTHSYREKLQSDWWVNNF